MPLKVCFYHFLGVFLDSSDFEPGSQPSKITNINPLTVWRFRMASMPCYKNIVGNLRASIPSIPHNTNSHSWVSSLWAERDIQWFSSQLFVFNHRWYWDYASLSTTSWPIGTAKDELILPSRGSSIVYPTHTWNFKLFPTLTCHVWTMWSHNSDTALYRSIAIKLNVTQNTDHPFTSRKVFGLGEESSTMLIHDRGPLSGLFGKHIFSV